MDNISEALTLVKNGVLRITENGVIIRLNRRTAGQSIDKAWKTCSSRVAGFKNAGGYLYFTWVSDNGELRHIRLHRLVYTYFHGAIPDGYEIHHADNNKLNNHPNNLILVTHKQNQRMAANDGLYQSVVGENNPCARIKETDVEYICELLSRGEKMTNISRKLDIPLSTINNLKRGKTWKHLDCVKRFHKKLIASKLASC